MNSGVSNGVVAELVVDSDELRGIMLFWGKVGSINISRSDTWWKWKFVYNLMIGMKEMKNILINLLACGYAL